MKSMDISNSNWMHSKDQARQPKLKRIVSGHMITEKATTEVNSETKPDVMYHLETWMSLPHVSFILYPDTVFGRRR